MHYSQRYGGFHISSLLDFWSLSFSIDQDHSSGDRKQCARDTRVKERLLLSTQLQAANGHAAWVGRTPDWLSSCPPYPANEKETCSVSVSRRRGSLLKPCHEWQIQCNMEAMHVIVNSSFVFFSFLLIFKDHSVTWYCTKCITLHSMFFFPGDQS